MLDVVIGLVPAMVAAGIFFREHAIILIFTCVVCALAAELICNIILRKPNPAESLGDLSAVVTGIIFALSIPPKLPIWAAIIGSVFSIGIGKMVFGGLGANIFNPAMVGRAFMAASFGMLMTTWYVPATIDADMPKISAENTISAMTQATPLALSKQAIKTKGNASMVNQQLQAAFWGNVGGCLGETSSLALLIGGIYLIIRKIITIRIPAAVLGSAFVISSIGYLINSAAYISPLTHLTTGGMLICAFFIATDPVTAPLSPKGMWIFGMGTGALIILIRTVGEYPEGVMYAVLLMNAATPLIDRFCKRIPVGGKGRE